MAKNTTKPRTKNYRKIIKAAQEEFALKGLNGARMQAIADRAGLPKANIHYYFKDKVTLYTAALNSVMETWNVFFESTEEEVLEPKKHSTNLFGTRSVSPLRILSHQNCSRQKLFKGLLTYPSI